MKSKSLIPILLLGFAIIVASAGCGGAKIDPGPEIAMLKQSMETIILAFKSGNPEVAHGSLHDVGFLLNQIDQKVKQLALPQEKRDKISGHTETLRKEFQVLDGYLHGEELPEDYDVTPVAEILREAHSKLKESLAAEVKS